MADNKVYYKHKNEVTHNSNQAHQPRDRMTDGSRNRAYDIRRDTDNYTTPVVNIYDIDYAILYHLKNNLAFTIQENDQQIPVQVMFANGETWSQIQRHGYLRDKSRKIMTPVIAIKRTAIATDDRFLKLDIPGVNDGTANVYLGKRQRNVKNDWINKTYETFPSFESYVVTLPEFVRVSYDLYIWTELTSHMNYIIEELIPEHRMPWGDTMTFEVEVGDMSFDTSNVSGEDRLVSSQMPLEVRGFIMPEYSVRESTVRKAHSIKRVDFINEMSQYELYPDHPPHLPQETRDRIDERRNDPLGNL